MAVVSLLGLGVLFVLPKMFDDGASGQPGSPTVGDASPVTVAQPATDQPQAVSSQQATKALQDFLLVQARLELANAPAWGEPQWSQAVAGAQRGNELFAQRQYAGARTEFERSLERLVTLESEAPLRLTSALASGREALEANDSEAALAFFDTAIAIDPGNEEALIGRERAQVRPELLRLMESGDLALSMKDLEKARDHYAEAARLDGLFEPAEAALEDVESRIRDLRFNEAMSQALTAIREERVKAAEAALQQADNLKSGQQVVADTRYQLEQLQRKLWLAEQRRLGADNESRERWAAAAAVYQGVLAREPRAGFARQGLERAADRARVHQQLDHYLEDPERVYTAEPRANAEKLLAAAGNAPENEPLLAEKIRRLETLVAEAKTPVVVVLQSDGLTMVSVYHVGRLGAFNSQQLELTPGTYTVVGSRPGYRDVRKTLTVKPGSEQVNLLIQCEEPI